MLKDNKSIFILKKKSKMQSNKKFTLQEGVALLSLLFKIAAAPHFLFCLASMFSFYFTSLD